MSIRKALFSGICAILLAGGLLHAAEKKEKPGTAEKQPPAVIESAEHLAQALVYPEGRAETLTAVALRYKKMGRTDKAQAILAEVTSIISTLAESASVRFQVAADLAKNGEYKRAFELAKVINKPAKKSAILLRIARKLVTKGQGKLANKVIKECHQTLKEADQKLSTSEKIDIRWFRLGKVLARKGEKEQAIKLFRETLPKFASSLPEGQFPKELRKREKNILIALANTGSYKQFTETVDSQYEGAKRGLAYFRVARALKEGKSSKARKLVVGALDQAETLNNKGIQAMLFAEMGRKLVGWLPDLARKATEKAVDSMKKTKNASKKGRAGDKLCKLYLTLDNVDRALEVARNIDNKYYRTTSIGEVAIHLAKQGEVDRAVQLLNEAPKKFERMDYRSKLAAICAEQKMVDKAMSLAKGIAHRALGPTALVDVANNFTKNGLFEESRKALNQVSGHPGFKSSAGHTLVEQIVQSATRDDYTRALSLAIKAVETIGPRKKAPALYKIAEGYQRFKELDKAFQVLKRAEKNLAKRTTACRVFAAQAAVQWANGNRDQARELVDRVARIMQRVRAKFPVASELVLQLERERKLQKLAVKLAQSFKSPSLHVHVLWKLADARAKDNKKEEAQKLYAEGLRVAKKIGRPRNRISTLLQASKKLLKANVEETKAIRTAAAELSRKSVAKAAKAKKESAKEESQAKKKGKQGVAKLAYFYSKTCSACASVEPIVKQLDQESDDITIRTYAISSGKGSKFLEALGRELGLSKSERGKVPAVFSSTDFLIGAGDIYEDSLSKLANSAKGQPAPWETAEISADATQRTAQTLGFVAVASGGLLDGINPCAFTVLIFFVSYLGYLRKEKDEIALAGLIFTGAVFVTYFAIGLGLLKLLDLGNALTQQFNQYFQVIVAALVLVLAIVSFRDGILYAQGREKESTLALPDSFKSRIKQTISRRARLGLTGVTTAIIGVAVALFEFPCTGQVYVPIMSLIHSEGFRAQALGWLFVYNLFFILPLLVVFGLTFIGLTSEHLNNFFKSHMAKVKFGLSALFLGLFAFLILYNTELIQLLQFVWSGTA